MLFGVKLQNEIYSPWEKFYIDYDKLKRLLKENVINHLDSNDGHSGWSEKDEALFAETLDKELEKVYSFQVSTYKQLDSEISKLELKSEKFLELLEQNKKDPSFDAIAFQKKLEELLSLANELDHFSRLNFTGFIKIVKKHDRLHKGYSVKALLSVRMKDLPLNNISEDTSPYLYRISTLYSFIRDQLNSSSLATSLSSSLKDSFNKLSNSGKLSSTPNTSYNAGLNESHFKVLKFWIHPDNLMEIKTTILRHLPVLIYNSNPNNEDADDDEDDESGLTDSTITSLYFDNRSFELYNNKLLKQLNKTPSLRIRWNGKLKNNPDLIVEKKTFDYDTGESNDVKLTLKEKYMNDFIFPSTPDESNGDNFQNQDIDNLDDDEILDYRNSLTKKKKASKRLTLDKFVKRLQKKGLSKSNIEAYTNSFTNLQDFILSNHLQPVLRTIYTRTAFQMPGDDRVRITIDSDILFVREDSFDQQRPIRDPTEWHRKDIDSSIENPYSLLRKGEYSKFPYSVMEIKIASTIVNNPQSRTLNWVNELTNSHLVKEVPNFSKFIQGISVFFLEDDNLDILPFWLPELEWDIRKNPEQAYMDSKNKRLKELQQAEVLKNLKKKIGHAVQTSTESGNTHLDQIVEDEEGDDLDTESSDDENSLPPDSTLPSKPITAPETAYSDNLERLPLTPFKRKRQNITDVLMPMFSSSKLEGYESEDEEIELPPGVVKPTQLIRQSGPVRVEAKVWLANERTFVRWLHVTTLLSALTFTIYSSVKASHFPKLATDLAYIYFALTLFSGVWAYAIYTKRLELIKLRSGRHLDGMFGPLVLAAVLILTLGLEFYAGIQKWKAKSGVSNIALFVAESVVQSPDTADLHPFTRWALTKLFSLGSY
ncbi:Phosphate metabolism transcription protein [Pichia californica]|uniref:Phosphate metabolism transcription protein n=1 Tax=Pichia californica TaxID=460514 RepID=A0A9P6WQC8_9ASCO|nr:Phosphate metabolism transcription protein [[Candida] californica]KAG0691151.1 Phosphate metabolism transcription protein [[Candida] californica]